MKLSLNQPTFNNYTKTLETYCQQEKNFIIKSEINALIEKKAIVQTIVLKRRKEIDKMKVEISRFQGAKLQRLYKCYGNF